MISTAESRYNQWVREHYRFLLRSAWALTGSRATAEDVVQDCFTSAWRFRHQLRDQGMARAWLFQIMRRHAFRHFDPAQHLPQELEQLIEQIESGQMPLEQMLAGYQRGASLLGFCRSRLDAVQEQIKVLDDGVLNIPLYLADRSVPLIKKALDCAHLDV